MSTKDTIQERINGRLTIDANLLEGGFSQDIIGSVSYELANIYDTEFDLVSGRYVIDAKSIMGIFSLDISKPIDLNIHAESGVDEILAKLKPYIVE